MIEVVPCVDIVVAVVVVVVAWSSLSLLSFLLPLSTTGDRDAFTQAGACTASAQHLHSCLACAAGQPACVESVQILCRASQLVWNLCRYCAVPTSLC
jgi:hypothetical protein